MQPSSQFLNLPAQPCLEAAKSAWKRDDFPYQAMTVAAILMLLCSMWVF